MKKKVTAKAKRGKSTSYDMNDAVRFVMSIPEISEAFTQAEIELAMDDRGWLPAGGRSAIELDSYSRTNTVNKCRFYWRLDPLPKQAVRLWTSYSFGSDGLTWQAEEGDNSTQTVLDRFMHDRRNRKLLSTQGQHRLSNKLLIDGEIFFAIFTDGTIRTVDCLQITDIISDPDDEETILAYRRQTKSGGEIYYRDWTAEEADMAKAYKPNTKTRISKPLENCVMYHHTFESIGMRGNSLLSTAINWSKEHRRFMEARVAITQALAKFAWKATAQGGQKKIDAIAARLQSTFVTSGTTGGAERNPQPAPASTFVTNKGLELDATPRTTGATEAREDSNNLKLMVSAGTGIMLHYFGDPSTGNLATATAMELPMLKNFQAYQKLWKDAFREIFSIVLEEGPEDDPAVIDIDLPPILADDLQKLGTFLTGLAQVFPEVKVPEILQMCLVSLGVNNIDEVMKTIDGKRKEIDQQIADQLAAAPAVVPPGTPPKAVAAVKESYDQLHLAIMELAKKL